MWQNLRVGDEAVVREWDDMSKEFETQRSGIVTKEYFTDTMRYFSGHRVRIREIYDCNGTNGKHCTLTFFDESYDAKSKSYSWDTAMLSPVEWKYPTNRKWKAWPSV